MNRFSIKLIARTDYLHNDGRCQIVLQMFINGKRLYKNISILAFPDNLDQANQCLTYRKVRAIPRSEIDAMNSIIANTRLRVMQVIDVANVEGRILDKQTFLARLDNDQSNKSFLDFMAAEIESLRPARDAGTIRSYKKILNKLRNFRSSITFADLTYDLVQKFEIRMCRDNLKPNSRWGGHKIVKKFINDAIKKNLIKESPYKYFRAYKVEAHISYLDSDELRTLIKLYSSNTLASPLQNVLRCFLFSCIAGGLRISDIKRLDHTNIQGNALVFDMYKFRMSKNKRIVIPVFDNSLNLVQRQMGKLFKTYSDQVTNRYLKQIMSIAGISKAVSFHVARHTFATQFLIEGGKLETLRDLLGHSKIETTMRYVHIVDRAKRDQMQTYSDTIKCWVEEHTKMKAV